MTSYMTSSGLGEPTNIQCFDVCQCQERMSAATILSQLICLLLTAVSITTSSTVPVKLMHLVCMQLSLGNMQQWHI